MVLPANQSGESSPDDVQGGETAEKKTVSTGLKYISVRGSCKSAQPTVRLEVGKSPGTETRAQILAF